jgi:hypothetical protein
MTVHLPRRRAVAAAVLLVLAAGCAGPRGGGKGPAASGSARAAEALVVRNDAAAARAGVSRALARRGEDPWAHLGAALLARRALDAAAEVRHLVAASDAAPAGPLALLALRRLSELAEESPARAADIEAGLGPLEDAGRFAGLAAYRARIARVTAAEVRGDHPRAAVLRRANGAVTAWTCSGPWGRHHALELDAPFPPEEGALPDAAPAPAGLPPRPNRALAAPDGTVTLEGEPPGEDVFYLAADVTLARGGRYLLTVGTSVSARVSIDGSTVHERRDFAGNPSTLTHLPVELAPGPHRVLVKLTRGASPRSGLHLALSREDGAASDAEIAAARPGAPPAALAPPRAGTPVGGPRALAAALEPEAGFALASLLAARDATQVDREGAKALLSQAVARVPASAPLRIARAAALQDDVTLDDQVGRARAEADLREALRRDPANAEARVLLAELLRRSERLDDADAALAGLEPAAAGRGAALEALGRVAEARGLAERAEALAAQALAESGRCGAADLAYALAGRRRAVADEDSRVRAVAACRDGAMRLAEHLRRRGDPRGAAEALEPVVAARPWSIEPALSRAGALVAAGDSTAAAKALAELQAVWPRSPRVAKKLADVRELAGDAAGARALRERALLLDGADLALRRALALEDGREVLDGAAEDGRAAMSAYEKARLRGATSAAMVLDAAAIELHPGGVATERTHQVIQVLDQQGVEEFGEVTIPHGADVLLLRTVKPDGRTVEPERAGASKGSVSLTGLEPGDYVEVEHLRAVRGLGGAYVADPFYFQVGGVPLFRSSYVVTAPEGLGLGVDAHGMPAPEVKREAGRELVRSLRTEVPAFVPEPGAVPMQEYLPFVQVGAGAERAAVQRGLGDAALERTKPTEELRALAAEIRDEAGRGAAPAALARAAYARVARTILGSGSALGEDASAVLSRGRGSRLIVLKALLTELGLRTRIALARPFSAEAVAYRFPNPGEFTHPLLRVEAGTETFWLDPSLRLSPFGAIPSSVVDVDAMVLPEPGDALEVVRTPERALVPEAREVSVRIALEPDGGGEVAGTDRYSGVMAAAAKAGLEKLDASERRQAVEAMLSRTFGGFAVEEVTIGGEDDPAAPLEIRWRGTVPGLARAADGGVVVDAPVFPARLASRYVQIAQRRTALLLPTPERGVARVEIVAPEGFTARAAAARKVETPFGTFARTERADGRTLVREDRLEVARGRIAPGQYRDFASFAAAVDAIQDDPAVFRP